MEYSYIIFERILESWFYSPTYSAFYFSELLKYTMLITYSMNYLCSCSEESNEEIFTVYVFIYCLYMEYCAC